MNEPIGRIAFERTAPRVSRVVKAKDRVKSSEDYIREHEICLLDLLIAKHLPRAIEKVRKLSLDGVKS